MFIGDDFQRLFRSFEHTAYRLEVRESYNAPREVESFGVSELVSRLLCPGLSPGSA